MLTEKLLIKSVILLKKKNELNQSGGSSIIRKKIIEPLIEPLIKLLIESQQKIFESQQKANETLIDTRKNDLKKNIQSIESASGSENKFQITKLIYCKI